jgi:predicted  nucleic acid-binding Zn-ribbon protein
MAGSSAGAPLAVASPSVQLRSLADELSRLETERAALQARLAELQERRHDARASGAGERSDEVGRLQSRADHARGQLASLQARHDKETGELADAERKLASARRQLEGLTLAAEPRPAQPARSGRARTGRRGGAKPARPTPAAAKPDPRSPAEVEAQARIKRLEGERDSLKTQMEAASRRVTEARATLKRDTDFAELVLDPRFNEPRIDEAAATHLNPFLAHYELPAIDQVPQGEDTRHARYLAAFTNVDAGARRLDESLLQNPAHSFSAFSALYSTLWPDRVNGSLLRNLLGGDMSAVMAAVRTGGEGLGNAVSRHVLAQFTEEMRYCALAAANTGLPDGTTARRVRLSSGSRVTQTALAEGRARARELMPLQELPAHRGRIVVGAIQQATSMMETIAEEYREACGDVQRSQSALDGALKDRSALVERGDQLKNELGAALAALSGLRDERRQRDAAQSAQPVQSVPSAQPVSRDAGPDAAIPQLPVAAGSSSPDVEARMMRLRGDVDRHTAHADEARSRVDRTARDIGEAQADLRRSAQAHEAAAAALARETANASREHDEVRAAQAGLRERLAVTEARIGEVRETLHQAPARRAAISDLAWERAIDRHVGISDEAMRERAPETGHVGSYDSLSTLSQVVADLHAHVSWHADLRPVLAARNRREFDSAVARVPGGVTDLVFDHGRQVGRGFSNALDRTERATPLQHSSYSLDFVQGRVVVSHLHPHVPRRTLQAAEL